MTQQRPSRPTARDPQVVSAAVEAIMPHVLGWLSVGEHDPGEVKQQLINCAASDAYRFASNLEGAYWSPDSELVDILDGYSPWLAREKAVKEWVSAHAITVPHAVGDIVTLRGQAARIVDIRSETAEIVAQPVEPDGKNYGATGGWVHAAEDAQPCEVTV